MDRRVMSVARLHHGQGSEWRLRALRFFFLGLALVVIVRLFTIQVWSGATYKALAEGQYSFYEQLVPERGQILVKDRGDETEYPVATTAPKAFVYADPRKVTDPVALSKDLAKILKFEGLEDYELMSALEQLRAAGRETEAVELELLWQQEHPTESLTLADNPVAALITRLSKTDDPYEPVARNVNDEQLDLIIALNQDALDYIIEDVRAYPEHGFGGQVLGFLGRTDDGQPKGYYGLEGYYNDFLAGQVGQLYSQTDSNGHWIGVGERNFKPAIDGGDLLLTIDRTLQVEVCKILARGVEQFEADSGTAIVLEPATGRVLSMCGAPDFYPGEYAQVTDAAVYNNSAIFSAYEPGSIFKPITMAAAIDTGAVTSSTRFIDPGYVEIDEFTIRNADDKVYGNVSMIEVLQESINTGMVWVVRQLGRDIFQNYVTNFGFGALTGITLKSEVAGTTASLNEQAEVYPATASFGQGITTTPLQIVSAYAALANDGMLMKPYIVDKLRYPDGTVERTEPQALRQIVSPSTATTIGAMLVSVVEYGHGKRAAVPGYYIGGKTGTAQIARNGVYSETEFNGSFAGFGPVADPKFAMIVKIENPKAGIIYAESTAAPIFGEIADFILEYYGVAPERIIE